MIYSLDKNQYKFTNRILTYSFDEFTEYNFNKI